MSKKTRTTKSADLARRGLLKAAAAGAAIVSMGGVSSFLAGCTRTKREEFLQKRFRELSPDEVKQVFARLEQQYKDEFGKDVNIKARPPLEGVQYGYALDLSRCIGCRRCVYGCVKENNQSRDPQIHWIRVLRMKKETGVDVVESDVYYDPAKVPEDEYFYMPVQCQQCDNPPCVRACPVSATWKEPDGIVVTDYNWCIGCRCCMTACPYGARHFNWRTPKIPSEEVNPTTDYLGNRPRPRGVVEKCTYCIQRVRERDGMYPACVGACPVGARKFGNLLDPDSEMSHILREKRVFVFKHELGTRPRFFYFYGV